jgi:hypothetical protein
MEHFTHHVKPKGVAKLLGARLNCPNFGVQMLVIQWIDFQHLVQSPLVPNTFDFFNQYQHMLCCNCLQNDRSMLGWKPKSYLIPWRIRRGLQDRPKHGPWPLNIWSLMVNDFPEFCVFTCSFIFLSLSLLLRQEAWYLVGTWLVSW